MKLMSHGDRKYANSELLAGATDWNSLRAERRQVGAGAHNPLTSQCTELVVILSGQAVVRRTGDGQKQQGLALPGTSWLVPAGTHETQLELDGPLDCLHIYLPAELLEYSALADYGIDPAKTQLAYAAGVSDPVLKDLGSALQGLLGRGAQQSDRLFVDGIRTAISAHLLGRYNVQQWGLQERAAPSLDAKRLARVLGFIEARLGSDISLDELAAEACFSPFHFSRLFRDATGMSPHRYVAHQRIGFAQKLLAADELTLVEVALTSGFGSQGSFTRAFHKATGLTPGQFRELQSRASKRNSKFSSNLRMPCPYGCDRAAQTSYIELDSIHTRGEMP